MFAFLSRKAEPSSLRLKQPEITRQDGLVLLRHPGRTVWPGSLIALFVLGMAIFAAISDAGPIGIVILVIVGGPALFLGIAFLVEDITDQGLDARIGQGRVVVTEHRRRLLGPRHWEEPISAFRGLHSFVHHWQTEVTERDSQGQERRVGWASNKVGLLLLEHASDPRRSLLLAKHGGGPVAKDLVEELAGTLGVTWRRSD